LKFYIYSNIFDKKGSKNKNKKRINLKKHNVNKGIENKKINEETKIESNDNKSNENENGSAFNRFTNKILDEHIKKKRKKVLINAIRYLCLNNIPLKDYLIKKIFPSKPFELRGSEEFMDAVKFNNIDLVKQGLRRSSEYLIQYDYFRQTPFHWAAKLGYYDMLKIMLDYSKMINVFDRELRTPLYLAALNNHKKCVEILLENGANAYLKDKNEELPENITSDNNIRLLLQNSQDKLFSEINEINKKKDKKEEDQQNTKKEIK
jgi:ankyrin repeat protein